MIDDNFFGVVFLLLAAVYLLALGLLWLIRCGSLTWEFIADEFRAIGVDFRNPTKRLIADDSGAEVRELAQ